MENPWFKNSLQQKKKLWQKLKKWKKEFIKNKVNFIINLEILKQKDNEKDIALGTSKTNYNDPRISVAWCKKNDVKIEKVFPKNLLGKFLWAMYTEVEW
jgi:DNA topoisomerase-1